MIIKCVAEFQHIGNIYLLLIRQYIHSAARKKQMKRTNDVMIKVVSSHISHNHDHLKCKASHKCKD